MGLKLDGVNDIINSDTTSSIQIENKTTVEKDMKITGIIKSPKLTDKLDIKSYNGTIDIDQCSGTIQLSNFAGEAKINSYSSYIGDIYIDNLARSTYFKATPFDQWPSGCWKSDGSVPDKKDSTMYKTMGTTRENEIKDGRLYLIRTEVVMPGTTTSRSYLFFPAHNMMTGNSNSGGYSKNAAIYLDGNSYNAEKAKTYYLLFQCNRQGEYTFRPVEVNQYPTMTAQRGDKGLNFVTNMNFMYIIMWELPIIFDMDV